MRPTIDETVEIFEPRPPAFLYPVADPVPAPSPPVVITPSPFEWREPASIPPRQWLYAKHYVRKYVGLTVAPGGVGKSTLALGEAIAMATGQPLLGNYPTEPLRVWYWNGEDPKEEIERRAAAICLHYGICREDIGSRLFIDSGRDTEIVVAIPEKGGVTIAAPVVAALSRAVSENDIDVVIIDPFVSSHRVAENDNPAIDAVAKTWAKIADATGCSIELIHHVRKTGGAEITAEDGRGASSLIAAARSVRVLNRMTEDEAARAGVECRRSFFRVDTDKGNLAPPSEKSSWFQLVSVPLGNGCGGADDLVGVATPWQWPNALDGLSVTDLRKVQDRIAEGDHAENAQAANWAGYAIAAALGLDANNTADAARVKSLLRTWIASGVLRVETRRNPTKGRDQKFVVVGARA